MNQCNGFIDSVYHGSAVDGKGLRIVVFFSGCNLRCPFCHNPETLYKKGREVSVNELVKDVVRYAPYVKNGGVTLSGGEPFLQRDFAISLIKKLNRAGLKVAIETNGSIADKDLIRACEYLIVDVKNQEKYDAKVYETLLSVAKECKKKVEITCVIVPSVNDTKEKVEQLKSLKNKFLDTVTGIRLLPYHDACVEKYQKLGKEFPYKGKPTPTREDMERVRSYINE